MTGTTTVAIDQRLQEGCYLSRYDKVYLLLGKEHDDRGCVTGNYVLEDCHGEATCVSTTSKVYVHRQITRTATEITRDYELARAASASEVPVHLEQQMVEHCKAVGI